MIQTGLDGLQAFLVVARQRSFTAAAAVLGVTPTAVSQKIKQLEARLGVVLFQRTTRRVALTEPGTALLARVGPALADVEDAVASLASFRGRPTGTLRITAPRTTAWLVAPIVARLQEGYPDVGIDLSLDDAFVDLVGAGFDAGIRLGDAIEGDMVRVPLTRTSSWSIVGSPAYLARAGRPEKPEELLQHRTIRQRLLASGTIYRWELERRGKVITIDVPRGVVVDDVHLMVALAIEGVGLAYVPDEQVVSAIADGRLERVLAPYLTPGPGLSLYFPARMQEQPKMRALLDTIAAHRREVEQRTPGPRTGAARQRSREA